MAESIRDRVLDYRAHHPNASHGFIGAALGLRISQVSRVLNPSALQLPRRREPMTSQTALIEAIKALGEADTLSIADRLGADYRTVAPRLFPLALAGVLKVTQKRVPGRSSYRSYFSIPGVA
jgi:hypothetical protein